MKKDCYGQSQDHICAMAKADNNWVLIDATLPYRKWAGYNTPHLEYEECDPHEFEKKFKGEEEYWANLALEWGDKRYAGLLYAPWIHEEVVVNAYEVLETIFYLLTFNGRKNWNLYVYYLHYTPNEAISPMMAIINPTNFTIFISLQLEKWREYLWCIWI